MNISPDHVAFDDDTMCVAPSAGRTLGVPLARLPRLQHATPTERKAVTLSPMGLHWDALDEDISVAGFMVGRGDMAGMVRVA